MSVFACCLLSSPGGVGARGALAWAVLLLPLAAAAGPAPEFFTVTPGLLNGEAESVSPTALNVYQADAELVAILRSVEDGKLDEARRSAERYLERSPESAPAHELLGVAQALQGNIDDGLAHLQRAVAINPRQSTAVTKIGDVFLARGDREKARAQFEQAIALNPADRLAHQRLGLMLEESGETTAAMRHFERGLVGAPDGYVGIKINLARLYNRAGRFQDAADLLSPVVPDSLPEPNAHLALGAAWLGLRQAKRALAAFERAKKLEPTAEAAHLGLGVAYRDSGDLDKSRAELEAALKLRPDFDAAALQFAETLVARKEYAEAIRILTPLTSRTRARTPILNRIAEIHALSQQHDQAAAVYRELVASSTADLRTFDGYATLLQVSGRLPEAHRVLEAAVEKYPDAVHARYRLGLHYALTQDYARALIVMERAREMAPTDPRIRKALSLAAYRNGNIPRALSEARRLLQLVPDNAEDQFYYASLLDESGDRSAAKAQYEKLLASDPKHVGALNNLALIHLRDGEIPAALEAATRAVHEAPEAGPVLDTMGWILHRAGRSREALPHLQKAVALKSPTSAHRYHLAAVMNQLGDFRGARAELTLALRGDADFPERESARKLADHLAANSR